VLKGGSQRRDVKVCALMIYRFNIVNWENAQKAAS